MKIIIKLTAVMAALVLLSANSKAQQRLDSLLKERDTQYNQYNKFKSDLKERPWIKLVELGDKASALIETDNHILKQYLLQEISLNQELTVELEHLNQEVALLNKETQMQENMLAERHNFANTLLYIITGLSALLIIMFVLFIDRQTRFRSVKLELERLWADKDGSKMTRLQKDELSLLSDQVNNLAEENDQLKQELNQEQGQKSEAMESLKKEIRSRLQIEQEIKDLISQIKKT
ncbi:MAG TPA: hypothetical protein P5514_10265 [Bacteroidales bacterium]|nr:hypothetical protein [Bacteroidales bacterium]HRX97318.1 hypothetical protein [Bacteroidales bacterium]